MPGLQQHSTSMNQDQQPKNKESHQEQLTLFSTPESRFVFKGPAIVQIKSTIKGEKNYCYLDHDRWSWKYAGDSTSIHWTKLNLNANLIELLKAFIFHRLQKLSPKTIVASDMKWISFLKGSEFHSTFPWDSNETILKILAEASQYEG